MKDEEFEEYWSTINKDVEKLDIAIIGGHTGRYVGQDTP